MKITQYIQEIIHRLKHIFIIATIELIILYKSSDYYLEFFLIEIKKIETIYKQLIISTDLTHILLSKFIIIIALWILFIFINCFIEYICFIKTAIKKKQFKIIKKNFIKITIYNIIIIFLLNKKIIYIINNALINTIIPYKLFNIQTIINLKDFIFYYIITTIVIYSLGFIIINIHNFKLNRKIFYFTIYLIISTITPPEIILHLKLLLPIIIITEILKIKSIIKIIKIKLLNKIYLSKWKRLDSNQRSKIQ